MRSRKGMVVNEILKIILFIIILVALTFFVTTRLADASDLFMKFLQAIGLAPPEALASAEVKDAMRCVWDRWQTAERPQDYPSESETACGYVMNHPNRYDDLDGEVVESLYCCREAIIGQICRGDMVPFARCNGLDQSECTNSPCCDWAEILYLRGDQIVRTYECRSRPCSQVDEGACTDCNCQDPPGGGGDCPEGSAPVDTSTPIDGIPDSCVAWKTSCDEEDTLKPTKCDSVASDPNIDSCEDTCEETVCETNEAETIERMCSSGRSNNAENKCDCLLKCPCWSLDKGGLNADANDGKISGPESSMNPVQVYIDGEFTLYQNDASYVVGDVRPHTERIHVSPTCEFLGVPPSQDINLIQLHRQLLPSDKENLDCSTSPDMAAYTKCTISGNSWAFIWMDHYLGRGFNMVICNNMFDLVSGCGGSDPAENDLKCNSGCCRDNQCKIADGNRGCSADEDCCNSDLAIAPTSCCGSTCCPGTNECCNGNECYDPDAAYCCGGTSVQTHFGKTYEEVCGYD